MALALTVAATTQTAYIAATSMSLKFNTFDFALVDPSTLPEVDDAVTLTDPAWSGTIKSVEITDTAERGTSILVTCTATNEDVLAADTAPFGISDDPDDATTYGYQGLSVKISHNQDDTTETRGSCTIFTEGIVAGMTLEVTSANRGYTAEPFEVQSVITTWPLGIEAHPFYALTFGSALTTFAGWVGDTGAAAAGGGPGPGFHDTFTRTGTVWGTADSDHVWANTGQTGDMEDSTTGNLGTQFGSTGLDTETCTTIAQFIADYWRLTTRFMVTTSPSDGSNYLDTLSVAWTVGAAVVAHIEWPDATDATSPNFQLDDGANPQVDYPDFQFTQGDWYILKWEWDLGKDISRLKCYREADGEPAAWLVNETGLYDYTGDPDNQQLDVSVSITTQGTTVTTFATDYLHVISDDTVALVFGEL